MSTLPLKQPKRNLLYPCEWCPLSYLSLWNEGMIPLLIHNHSGINGAESKQDSYLRLFMKQFNESTQKKFIDFLFYRIRKKKRYKYKEELVNHSDSIYEQYSEPLVSLNTKYLQFFATILKWIYHQPIQSNFIANRVTSILRKV